MQPSRAGVVVVAVLALIAGTSLFTMPTDAQDPKPKSSQQKADDGTPKALRDFMRQKLQASNQVLEGLALENMDMIKEGATSLNKMSSAEKWRVRTDAMYNQFSGEFQRNTQELIKSAEEGNLDKSALKWMAATMNCIECHRFVRNHLVVR